MLVRAGARARRTGNIPCGRHQPEKKPVLLELAAVHQTRRLSTDPLASMPTLHKPGHSDAVQTESRHTPLADFYLLDLVKQQKQDRSYVRIMGYVRHASDLVQGKVDSFSCLRQYASS